MCVCAHPRREWEETARKALGGKHTLHSLLEVLAGAADMGADDSPLALHLRSKVRCAALPGMDPVGILRIQGWPGSGIPGAQH